MSLTNRIQPGDALDADEVEANFADLDALISPLTDEGVERGAINTRHVASATEWKILEEKTHLAAVGGAGAFGPTIVVPFGGASTFATESGQAYLILGLGTVTSAGAAPSMILRLKITGATVIQRQREFPVSAQFPFPIAWLAVATGATATVELEAQGVDATIQDSKLTVLAVRR